MVLGLTSFDQGYQHFPAGNNTSSYDKRIKHPAGIRNENSKLLC